MGQILRVRIQSVGAPLRVFVGTSPDGMDEEACAVLEYSLRRHASVPVEVVRIQTSSDPASPLGGWSTERWATPWTALRWAIPEMCEWSGRAIYFDCTSLILGDIAELGAASFPLGSFLMARREGCELSVGCLVFDCAEARPHLPAVEEMKRSAGIHGEIAALLERRPRLVGPLPGVWGRSDAAFSRAGRDAQVGGSVHFPRPQIQPHGMLADVRLRAAGRSHWFRGARLPHYCVRLSEMWGAEYDASRGGDGK